MKEAVLFLEPKGTIMEVVRVAHERGYYVAAITCDPTILETLSSPYDSARSCINETIEIKSWEDKDRIFAIIERIHAVTPVKGVYFGLDATAVLGTEIRRKFGLPSPSREAMENIIDKHVLRSKLRERGLSNLKSFHGSEVDGWTEWPNIGAVYFKPVRGAFSLYVKRCENLEELKQAKTVWQKAADPAPAYIRQYLNSKKEYHVEEAFDGELLSVEGISFKGEFQCIGLTSRILYSKDPTVEMGSCFPYPHSLASQIIDQVKKAHMALGFTDGPSHTEVIVNSEGKVEIIDFNPRFIGDDVLQSINNAYGIRIEEVLLDWTVGQIPRFSPKRSLFSCIQYVLPPDALTFQCMDFPEAPEVKFHTVFPKPGARITAADRQIDYLGCYVTVMPSFKSAIERSRELRSFVKINGMMEGRY